MQKSSMDTSGQRFEKKQHICTVSNSFTSCEDTDNNSAMENPDLYHLKLISPIVGPINMCVHIMHKGELGITSVVFLPKVCNLNVIMKKCQTKHLPSK